jgi:hypothetical protein
MRNGSGGIGGSSVPGSPRLPGFAAPPSGSSPYGRGDTSGAGGYGSSPAIAGPYGRGETSGAGGYGSTPAIAGPYGRSETSGAGGYGSTPAIAGPYGSRTDLQGSRTNLMQDGYGGGYNRGGTGSPSQSYGIDRYNNNSGYGDGRNSPYGGNGSSTGGYTRPSRSPVNTTPVGTSSHDYAQGGSNYDRYGGGSSGGYGNSSSGYGNTSSSRPAQYPGQNAYGGSGRGGAGSGWRDL